MCWLKWAADQGEFIKNSKNCSMEEKGQPVGSTTKLKLQHNQAVLSKSIEFWLLTLVRKCEEFEVKSIISEV